MCMTNKERFSSGFFDAYRNSYMAFFSSAVLMIRFSQDNNFVEQYGWILAAVLGTIWFRLASLRLRSLGFSVIWSLPIVFLSVSVLWQVGVVHWAALVVVNLPLLAFPSKKV